jgi:peptide/nickel transport system substrate-binding protein
MQFLAPPQAFYVPKTYDDDLVAVWGEMNNLPTPEARQDAFVRMQKMVLDHAYALPFGALTKVQVLRANVKNFIPSVLVPTQGKLRPP